MRSAEIIYNYEETSAEIVEKRKERKTAEP